MQLDVVLVIRIIDTIVQRTVLSAGKVYEDDAMLRALQQREEANRNGKQSSIIMIRDYNEFGES